MAGGCYYNIIEYTLYAALFIYITYSWLNFLTLVFFLLFCLAFSLQALLEWKILFLYYSFCFLSDSPPFLQFWGLFPPGLWSPQVLYELFGALDPQWCRGITDTVTEPINDLPGSQVERLRLAFLNLQTAMFTGSYLSSCFQTPFLSWGASPLPLGLKPWGLSLL